MAAQISPSPPTMPHVGPCEYGQFLRSQLVHSTCHTSSLPSIVAEGVVQARHLRSYAPAVRTRSTVAPASSELPWLPSVPQTPPARSAPSMDLSVAATDQRDWPLPVAGFKGTPEEIEQQWYEQVYRGRGDSMAQLTWRAVLILMPGSRVVAHQSLHRSQSRLGLRRRHYGQHLVLCNLDELAQSRPRAHADDHP